MIFLVIYVNFLTCFATDNIITDLKSSDNQADYIVITHPDFKSEIDNFVQWRHNKSGLNIKIVDVNDIYSQFSNSEKAESISDFTSYSMNSWSKPSPRFILLVGSINHIPSKRIASELKDLGEDSVSIDQWYAINHADSDFIPDIALGRFPARTIEDLQNMVAKTIYFEDKFDEIDYQYDYTAFTDNYDPEMFEMLSENFIQSSLPQGCKIKKIYNRTESEFHGNKSDLFNTLNSGTAIFNNFVHGAPCIWGRKIIVNCDDIDTTHFLNKPFLLTSIACSQSYDNPLQKEILEKLITMKSGGTFASIASAGIDWANQSWHLLNTIYIELFYNTKITLGEALQQAYIKELDMDENTILIIHRFSLLGDPALKIPQKLIASVQLASSEPIDENIIYPNPVSDYLYFKSNSLSNNQQIQIFTLEGTKVMEIGYNDRIDVSKLVSGMYILKVGDKFYKFIKM
jgi:hypothetical protein